MRAITYDRVSADRAQGRSISEQNADNEAECARRGWTIVARYTDNDRGASRHSRTKRPGWEQVKAAIADRQGEVLVTWEASRAQRDVTAYVELRQLCRDHNVQWCYNGRLYDLSRTDDSFSTGLDALLAEREADVTRDRVLRAVKANAAAGRPHGKLLYGYRREYDLDSGALVAQVPREDQAAIVREIHQRIAAGDSVRGIGLDLERRGVPAPGGQRWYPQTVAHIARNPAYIGRRVHQGADIGAATWPPLVDEITHYTCVRRLTDPDRPRIDWTIKHLLSGLARCGAVIDGKECGSGLRAQMNRNHLAYVCPAGFHVSRHAGKLEEMVTTAVLGRLTKDDALDDVNDRRPIDTGEAASSVSALRHRLQGFHDAAADGQISPAALARIEARLLPQIAAAEHDAGTPDAPPRFDAAGLLRRWERMSLQEKRVLIAAVVDTVVLSVGRGKRVFDAAGVDMRWKS